jgi:outer membrane receptor protein involved in Fe transport
LPSNKAEEREDDMGTAANTRLGGTMPGVDPEIQPIERSSPRRRHRARHLRTTVARSGLAATLLLGASPLLAQAVAGASDPAAAAAPAGGDETGDIIVTAQRREQRLQDVPVAVSVVTGASLQRSNLTSLEDISARLPDLKVAPGTISNSIVVRGVGSGANPGFEQAVATFVDGVYRSRSRSTRAALFDIERVEVLKGPQITFFGANAIAGALNIVTRKAADEFDYNASIYGVPSTGEYDGQFGVSVPIAETLSVRYAGRIAGSDGYIKNDFLDEDGPRDRTLQGRLSLNWQPSDNFRSDLRVEGSRSRTRNALAAQLVGCPPPAGFTISPVNTCGRYLRQNGGNIDADLDYHTAIGRNYLNYKFAEAAWTNQLDLGTGSLNAITSYFVHSFRSEGQAVPFPLTDAVGGPNGYPTYQTERFDQFSQELRYQSEAGGAFEYMFGGYFSKGDLDLRTIAGFRFLPFGANDQTGRFTAASPLAGNNYGNQNDRTLSGFASATIRPVEAVRVNLGARYSSIRKRAGRSVAPGLSDNDVTPGSFQSVDAATQAIIAAILATNTANFPNPRRTDTKFMPSVSVQYDLAPDVMAYGSYSEGFKAGGYSFGANNEEFEPETVKAYEAGLKGKFLDGAVTGDLTVYRSDYRNLQEATLQLQTNGTIASLIQNVARSRSQGVELGATVRTSQWLTLTTNIAYLDAKYTSYPNGACTTLGLFQSTTCRQDLSGRRRSYAPEWSGNFGARITAPFGDDYRLTVDPLVYFTSRFFLSSTADPLLEQRANTKIDLRVGFGPQNGRWEVAVIGRNLTDKATSQFRQSIPLAPGSVSAVVDPPRTIGFQLTLKR